jgi:hypothetical protein
VAEMTVRERQRADAQADIAGAGRSAGIHASARLGPGGGEARSDRAGSGRPAVQDAEHGGGYHPSGPSRSFDARRRVIDGDHPVDGHLHKAVER